MVIDKYFYGSCITINLYLYFNDDYIYILMMQKRIHAFDDILKKKKLRKIVLYDFMPYQFPINTNKTTKI